MGFSSVPPEECGMNLKPWIAAIYLLIYAATALPAQAAPNIANAVIVERDGAQLHMAAFAGKFVLINFWATWCGACQIEAPDLAQLSREPDLAVIGLSDEAITPTQWQAYLIAHPFPYQVALVDRSALPHGISPAVMMVQVRPISYLIGPQGDVVKRFVGTVTVDSVNAAIAGAQR